MQEIAIEICSNCHPVYTGVKKIVDAAGRVEKFQERIQKAKELRQRKPTRKTKRKNPTRKKIVIVSKDK